MYQSFYYGKKDVGNAGIDFRQGNNLFGVDCAVDGDGQLFCFEKEARAQYLSTAKMKKAIKQLIDAVSELPKGDYEYNSDGLFFMGPYYTMEQQDIECNINLKELEQ